MTININDELKEDSNIGSLLNENEQKLILKNKEKDIDFEDIKNHLENI